MRNFAKDGEYNENTIISLLDKHYYKDLADNWKRHMKRMFPRIKDEDMIYAHKYEYKDAKPDIVIDVNNKRIMLSIKSGHAPVMHYESVYTFYQFLRSLGVPQRIMDIISFYHYGYKMNTGKYFATLTREEILRRYPEEIKEVNDYFDRNDAIVTQIMHRAIVRGRIEKRDLIDFFYYGNPAKGFLLSLGDIYHLIIDSKNNTTETLCFKQLTYVVAARDPLDSRHHNLKIHWPILCKYFYDEEFMKKFG